MARFQTNPRMVLAGLVLAGLVALPAIAQTRNAKPPLDPGQPFAQGIEAPEQRPDPDAAPDTGFTRNETKVPLPVGSPERPQDPAFIEQPDNAPRVATDPTEPGETVDIADSQDEQANSLGGTCLARLQAMAKAERISSPAAKDAECVIPDPVSLTGTSGAFAVGYSQALALDCPMAEAFAQFTREVAQPLARHHVGKTLTKISTGPGFSCRRRNRLPTGKLSEHALGNGVDIVGFSFEGGERFSVVPASALTPKQARFQAALRQAACGWFTTILGPGSNAAHADHLHFDLGRTKNLKPGREPYRICE